MSFVLILLCGQHTLSNIWLSIHHRHSRRPHAHGAPDPTRETYRVSRKPKRRLTKNQERRRIEGLRILARIIARHYLANPHLYPSGAATANGRPTEDGKAARTEGEA